MLLTQVPIHWSTQPTLGLSTLTLKANLSGCKSDKPAANFNFKHSMFHLLKVWGSLTLNGVGLHCFVATLCHKRPGLVG